MIIDILIATAIVGGIGAFIGLFLGIAGIKFKVEVDEREEAISDALPGNNCGGCGYPGCSGLATAIVKGEAEVNACPVGGSTVGHKIAAIMGVQAEAGKRTVAFVKCAGDCNLTTKDYDYTGIEDCRMLSFVPNGGPKACNYGCLGYGTCVNVCPFDAIHIVDGIAVVESEACKACSKCIAVCPKNLITLLPYEAEHKVVCSSKDKGAVTMKACKIGCIGCGICVKNCPSGAITVVDFVATIDQDQCTNCGICKEKCPKKVIS